MTLEAAKAALLALVGVLAHAAPLAAQTVVEALVDPAFIDCAATPNSVWTSASTAPDPAGPAATGSYDIDGDGAVGAGTEDTDGDLTFGTITTAVSNTASGGVVEVTVPGVYRPADGSGISITRSMIVRGPRDQDVIIAGNCPDSASTGISISGSSLVVVLENLTVRSFTIGVDVSSCNGCRIELVNCRLMDNTDGLRAVISSGSSSTVVLKDSELTANENGANVRNATLRVHDSSIVSNYVGVGYCDSDVELAFHGSDVSASVTDGVGEATDCLSSSPSVTFSATRSRFAGNLDDGVDISNGGSAAGNHVVRASDSVFAENGGDGLVILTNSGTPTPVTLAECRFMGNGGDGIEVSAPGAGGAVTVALWKNTIIQNAGAGLRDSGSNTSFPTTSGNNSACVNNLFGANVGGNFVGFGSTPPCGNSASAAHADHESTF